MSPIFFIVRAKNVGWVKNYLRARRTTTTVERTEKAQETEAEASELKPSGNSFKSDSHCFSMNDINIIVFL